MENNIQNLKQNSFEISKTSTGKYSWTVKVYDETINDLDGRTRIALDKIKAIMKELEKEV